MLTSDSRQTFEVLSYQEASLFKMLFSYLPTSQFRISLKILLVSPVSPPEIALESGTGMS